MNESCEDLGRRTREAEVDGEICERDRKLVTELKGGVRA